MRLKSLFQASVLAGGLIAAAGTAQADVLPAPGSLDFDFRTLFDAGTNGAASDSAGGVTLTTNGNPLFWAADDGIGIQGGEPDEINYPEELTVTFDTPQDLVSVWLSDIFESGDGVDDEEATIQLFSAANVLLFSQTFAGNEPLGTNNGGLLASFGAGVANVSYVVFNSIDQTNDEYSVVGFVSGDITEVPEPGTIALLGAGLLGLAGLRRRRV